MPSSTKLDYCLKVIDPAKLSSSGMVTNLSNDDFGSSEWSIVTAYSTGDKVWHDAREDYYDLGNRLDSGVRIEDMLYEAVQASTNQNPKTDTTNTYWKPIAFANKDRLFDRTSIPRYDVNNNSSVVYNNYEDLVSSHAYHDIQAKLSLGSVRGNVFAGLDNYGVNGVALANVYAELARVLVVGGDKLENGQPIIGNYANDSGVEINWITGSGVSINTGKLVFTTSTADATQDLVDLVPGNLYFFEYTIESISAGGIHFDVENSGSSEDTSHTSAGTYNGSFKFDRKEATIRLVATGSTTATISNFRITPLDVNGPELIDITDFTDDSSNNSTVTESGGVVTGTYVDGAPSYMHNGFPTVVGQIYKLTVNFLSGTPVFGVWIRSSVGTAFMKATVGLGVSTITFKAISTITSVQIFDASPASFTFQDLSCKTTQNLVEEGEFSSDDIWTITDPSAITISSGACSWDGTQTAFEYIGQDIDLVVGKQYLTRFTVSNYSAGYVRLVLGGTSAAGTDRSANGTFTEIITASSGNLYNLIIQGNTSFVGDIDNVEVYEYNNLIPNGTFDTDADWTKAVNWSIGSGVASSDGSSGSIYTTDDLDLQDGDNVLIRITLSNRTSGDIRYDESNGITTGADVLNYSANGTYERIITVPTGAEKKLYVYSDSYLGDIDNVEVFLLDDFVKNGSFLQTAPGWVDSSSGAGTSYHTGNYIRITNDAGASDTGAVKQTFSGESGKEYYFEVETHSGSTGSMLVKINGSEIATIPSDTNFQTSFVSDGEDLIELITATVNTFVDIEDCTARVYAFDNNNLKGANFFYLFENDTSGNPENLGWRDESSGSGTAALKGGTPGVGAVPLENDSQLILTSGTSVTDYGKVSQIITGEAGLTKYIALYSDSDSDDTVRLSVNGELISTISTNGVGPQISNDIDNGELFIGSFITTGNDKIAIENNTISSTVYIQYCYVFDEDELITEKRNKSWLEFEESEDHTLHLNVMKEGDYVYLGEIIAGYVHTIGETSHGINFSGVEYNSLELDEEINRWRLTRDEIYRRRVEFPVVVEKNHIGDVDKIVSRLTNRSCYFVGSEQFNFTEVFGYIKDFSPVIDNYHIANYSIEVEEV